MWARVSPCTVSTEIEIDDELITTADEAQQEAIETAKRIEDWEERWGHPIFNTKDLDKDSITVDSIEKLDDDDDEEEDD